MSRDQKSALVRAIVTSCTNGVVASIVTTLQGLSADTENDRGGSGRGLASLWEEYKYQFQREHTDFEDRYQRVVWPLCREAVGRLPLALQQLLWLETDDFDEHDIDQEQVTLADFDPAAVVTSIYNRLRDVANNEPLIFDPDQECMNDEELSELAMECWPSDWPGRRFVELDNLGDPGDCLSQWVVEPCLDRLTDGEIGDDDPLADSLREDYLAVLEQNAFSPPWEFGDDPKDPKWIAECEEAIRKEFIAFLRAWRQNMKAKMSS